MPVQDNSQLPAFDQVQARFDNASELRMPHYSWIPPKWKDLPPSKRFTGSKGLPDNCLDKGPFEKSGDVDKQIELRRANAKTAKAELPHPLDNYRHVDPEDFSDQDLERLRKHVSNHPDQGVSDSLTKLGAMAGSDSPGMSRLGKVFKWVISTVADLFEEINLAIQTNDQPRYEKACEKYNERLRDLDDPEPENRKNQGAGPPLEPIGPGQRGYGKVMKWVMIDPVIVTEQIVGMRVIIHWNPHSSSNGVPILHN